MHNIHPSSHDADQALSLHSQRIKRSALYLLNTLTQATDLLDPSLEKAKMIILRSRRFHPEVHYYHNKLIRTMKTEDAAESKATAQCLVRSIIQNPDDTSIKISSIGGDHWEADAIGLAVATATAETGLLASAAPVEATHLAAQVARVRNAIALIEQHHPETYAELVRLIWSVKLFTGRVTQGLTDTKVFGEIYIRTPRDCVDPTLYYVEHVAHETAHTYLNCLMASDPIIFNGVDERFSSPLRNDPRPMYGVYHATFVASRMALTFKKIYENTGDTRCLKLLAEVSDEAIRGADTVRAYARLTPTGDSILTAMEGLIEQIMSMSAWDNFDFSRSMPHRCGAGVAQFSALKHRLDSK